MQPIDSTLMTRFRAGDHEAFTVIVERHKEPLIRSLVRSVRSEDLAEDLAQEAFVRLYETRGRFREEKKIGHYLLMTALNLRKDRGRRDRSWRELLAGLRATTVKTSRCPEAIAIDGEMQRQILAASDQLTGTLRTAVNLHDFEGWTLQEIAAATGTTAGNVRTRLRRAHELMRRHLTPWWTGEKHDQRPEGRSDHQCSEEPADTGDQTNSELHLERVAARGPA